MTTRCQHHAMILISSAEKIALALSQSVNPWQRIACKSLHPHVQCRDFHPKRAKCIRLLPSHLTSAPTQVVARDEYSSLDVSPINQFISRQAETLRNMTASFSIQPIGRFVGASQPVKRPKVKT